MDNNTTQFYVGQTVYDEVRFPGKPGKVERIDATYCGPGIGHMFPIVVSFGEGHTSPYTQDGRYMSKSVPTLLPTRYKVTIEPVEEPFKPGEIVEVRDGNEMEWFIRVFHSMNEKPSPYLYRTVSDHTDIGVVTTSCWKQCRRTDMATILSATFRDK